VKKKSIDSFKVGLNWIGGFEVLTGVVGIIMSLALFFGLMAEYIITGEKRLGAYLFLFLPLCMIGLCVYLISPLISDRIIVNGTEIIIKRAYKKKKVLSPDDIISYSNTSTSRKGYKHNELSVKFGDNESIYIYSDKYKNYDLLIYYLFKNCPRK